MRWGEFIELDGDGLFLCTNSRSSCSIEQVGFHLVRIADFAKQRAFGKRGAEILFLEGRARPALELAGCLGRDRVVSAGASRSRRPERSIPAGRGLRCSINCSSSILTISRTCGNFGGGVFVVVSRVAEAHSASP